VADVDSSESADSSGSSTGTGTSAGISGGRAYSALQFLNHNGERILIFVLYTYLIFIILAAVIRRFILDFSSLWGTRTAVYAYLYLTYIGMSWAVYKRAHIRLDVIFQYVSERVEGYLYIFSDLTMLAFAAYTIWYSIPLIQTSIEFGAATQALRVNRVFFQIAIPLGFTLFSARVLQRLYYDVKDVRNDRPVYKGDAVFLTEEEEEAAEEAQAEAEADGETGGGRTEAEAGTDSESRSETEETR
jgi:TRAP-type C4-dicarboxylate transport system permease small subunit